MVHVGKFHAGADTQLTGIGFFLAHDHTEQGGFAGTVRADNADDAAGRQVEGKLIVEQCIAKTFA